MRNKKTKNVKLGFILLVIFLFSAFIVYSIFFQNNFTTKDGKEVTIEIPKNASLDIIIEKLNENGELSTNWTFKLLSKLKKYNISIKSGNYRLSGSYKNNDLINILRQRNDHTFLLIIPENIRKSEEMFSQIEDSISFEKGSMISYINNSNFLSKHHLSLEEIPAIFIPNTYEFYSNVSVPQFFERMVSEYSKFWNKDRVRKKDSLGISKTDVSILASIVEEEQDKRIDERSMIAGLYLNRLVKYHPDIGQGNKGKLQADPTLIFAIGDFKIKRVLDEDKKIDSPFNTYLNKGLPPGPICIPSIDAIDAVLN
ncbi:MAG: endolytic transglycosylase MltG, partial [Flavobacteriales bacterium]